MADKHIIELMQFEIEAFETLHRLNKLTFAEKLEMRIQILTQYMQTSHQICDQIRNLEEIRLANERNSQIVREVNEKKSYFHAELNKLNKQTEQNLTRLRKPKQSI